MLLLLLGDRLSRPLLETSCSTITIITIRVTDDDDAGRREPATNQGERLLLLLLHRALGGCAAADGGGRGNAAAAAVDCGGCASAGVTAERGGWGR